MSVFLFGFSSFALGQNSTHCSNGSSISCEAGQYGWCKVFPDGKIEGGCKNPPANKHGVDLLTWLFSEVLGKPISVDDLRKEYKISRNFSWEVDGEFVKVKGRWQFVKQFETEVVTFSISGKSSELRKALEAFQREF
jgi:hypothetical protein